MKQPVSISLVLALCRPFCQHHRETEINRTRSFALEGFGLVSSTNRQPRQPHKCCDVELDTGAPRGLRRGRIAVGGQAGHLGKVSMGRDISGVCLVLPEHTSNTC